MNCINLRHIYNNMPAHFSVFYLRDLSTPGKKTAAIALTEHLFKTTNILYSVQPSAHALNSILDIKLQCHVW